ncbi:MAG: DUF559 domain-containing protein [Candidatus Bathyarchaeia archaeon]
MLFLNFQNINSTGNPLNLVTFDFYLPTLYLGLEVDGNVHDNQRLYGTRRDNVTASHGIHIFRFNNDNVLNNSQVVASAICRLVELHARHSPKHFLRLVRESPNSFLLFDQHFYVSIAVSEA